MRRFLRRAAASLAVVSLAATIASGQLTPPKPKAAPAESIPLSKYAPAENLVVYFESDGFQASHADAWKNSAAYKILNDTSTGAMFEDVGAQLLERARISRASNPAPGGGQGPAFTKAASGDSLTVIKHALNSGFVLAGFLDPTGKNGIELEVYRNVTGKATYEAFVRWTGASGSPTTKFGVMTKRGRKVVVVDDSKSPRPIRRWAWWFEKNNDLVRVDDEGAVDLVLDLIEGKSANASTNARVAGLAAAEGAFQPVVRGFVDLERMSRLTAPTQADGPYSKFVEATGIKGFDLRYGLDGKALMNVVRVWAPSPRKPALAVFDQTLFSAKGIPPIPASASSYRVLSLDSAKLYDSAVALVKSQGNFDATGMGKFVEKFQEKSKLKLREDILARLGPRMAVFRLPSKAPGPLSVGFQVPKMAVVFESPDMEGLGRTVDQLVYFANREFKAMIPAPPDDDKEKEREKPANRRGGAAKKKAASPPPAPEFTMISPTPRTYLLKLPPSYAALTNASVTIVLGKRHLAIASDPATANEFQKAEEKAEGRWKAAVDLVDALDRLPSGLMYLSVADPKDSLPQALATFPAALQNALDLASGPAAMMAMPTPTPPAGAAAPAPSGGGGLAPPPGMQRFGMGIMFVPKGGSMGSGGQPPEGTAPAAPPPGNAPPTPPPAMVSVPPLPPIKVDPSKLPGADAIKPLLFPGLLAASVDDQGIKVIGRDAFPDVSIISVLTNPMLRSLLPGGSPPVAPIGAPGTASGPGGPPPSGPQFVPGAVAPGGAGGSSSRPASEPR